jgi:hypothetical protein
VKGLTDAQLARRAEVDRRTKLIQAGVRVPASGIFGAEKKKAKKP